MKHILIRKEQENEFRTVENLVREAFWDVYRPGCDEHLLVHRLRDSSIHLPELSFIAEVDGRLAGQSIIVKRSSDRKAAECEVS